MSRFANVFGSAQREDWGTSIEVREGLFRIRLQNPVSPLMVNSYAYTSGSELIVIDPGWPWTLDAMEQALRDIGLARSFHDVDAWLYTHTHIDHMGPAALLSDISDAPHYTWSAVEPFVDEWHAFQNRMNDWTPWGETAFDDDASKDELRARTNRRKSGGVEFLLEAHGPLGVRNVEYLEFDDVFDVADLRLRFIDARGHDPYHGAFYEPDRKWLFCGDVVIATPTPVSQAMEDDLRLYMESLDRLDALDTELLLPGHGVQRGGDLAGAYARSRSYQEQYRERLLEALDRAEPAGLMQLSLELTPSGTVLEPYARWIVHLALVDSHLRALVSEEVAERLDGPRYQLL